MPHLHASEIEMDRLSNLPDTIIHHILSLMDTKYAVQTCVLSQSWRYHWTNIHALNFDCRDFSRVVAFNNFVTNVLRDRKPLCLDKLRFYCRDIVGVGIISILFEYATLHRFEELDTDIVSDFPSSVSECQSLKTLKLSYNGGVLSDLFGFKTLVTLQLYEAYIPTGETLLYKLYNCLNLVNLLMIRCQWPTKGCLAICAPQLVNLTISGRMNQRQFEITAPTLKVNLCGNYPILLNMDKRTMLDKVNIHLSPPIDFLQVHWRRPCYTSKMQRMVEGLCRSMSLTVLSNFPEETKKEE